MIAGYFSHKGRLLETNELRAQLSEFRVLPSEAGVDPLIDVAQIRFGHLLSKRESDFRHQIPMIKDPDNNVLMISGYLFAPGPDDAYAYHRLLVRCLETRGEALEACEGEFVGLFAEGRSGILHIVNDRFAAWPFYLLTAEDRTFFSSNLAFLCSLTGGKFESDVVGWLQIFLWDHTMGSRTHLRGVSSLRPASHMILSPDWTRENQYWRFHHQVDEQSDPSDTAWHVFDAFRHGTERRARKLKKGVVTLSGGADSRLVAGTLSKGVDFSAFTFVDSVDTADTLDVRVAAQVSKILGLQHMIKPIPRGWLSPQRLRDIIALTGGLVPIHHTAKTLFSISAVQEHGIDCFMGGGASGLSGYIIPSARYLDPANTARCLREFCQRRAHHQAGEPILLKRLFRHDVLREYAPRVTPSVMESFEGLEGPTTAHRMSAWTMAHRYSAFISTSPCRSHPGFTEAVPHLGYAYTDLMLRLPAAWLYKATFYRFMIFQCLPLLREVILANSGKCLPGQFVDVHSEGSERWQMYYNGRRTFISRSLRARFPSFRRRGTHDPSFNLLSQNDQLLSHVAEIVRSRRSLAELLDVKECAQFVDKCRGGRVEGSGDDARLLGTLTTMCEVFEFFGL